MARKRLKNRLLEEIEKHQLKFYLICWYEDIRDADSCIDEMQTKNYDFAKEYIGSSNFRVFAVYEDGLMEELYKIEE